MRSALSAVTRKNYLDEVDEIGANSVVCRFCHRVCSSVGQRKIHENNYKFSRECMLKTQGVFSLDGQLAKAPQVCKRKVCPGPSAAATGAPSNVTTNHLDDMDVDTLSDGLEDAIADLRNHVLCFMYMCNSGRSLSERDQERLFALLDHVETAALKGVMLDIKNKDDASKAMDVLIEQCEDGWTNAAITITKTHVRALTEPVQFTFHYRDMKQFVVSEWGNNEYQNDFVVRSSPRYHHTQSASQDQAKERWAQ